MTPSPIKVSDRLAEMSSTNAAKKVHSGLNDIKEKLAIMKSKKIAAEKEMLKELEIYNQNSR